MATILSVHAGYRCRDSGVCCTSGWEIPVEATVHRTVASALASGQLRLPRDAPVAPFVSADLPPEYARLLGLHGDGACVFYDAGRRACVIHASLGAHAKPISCRAFPHLIVVDPRGVSRSLSHYCPSAADLLFEDGRHLGQGTGLNPVPGMDHGISLIEVPSRSGVDDIEGLDAREGLPPALRDDVLMDWESLGAWERLVMTVLDAAASPEAALDRLRAAYERLRLWRASDGPLVAQVARVADVVVRGDRVADAVVRADRVTGTLESAAVAPRMAPIDARALVAAVWTSIPPHIRPAPVDAGDPHAATADVSVDAMWRASSRVLCRYLAARAHACWPLYQGQGLSTQLASLDAALALVRAHAHDEARRHGGPLDTAGLRDAIRRADLWLVHFAAPAPLARALDALQRR